MLWNGMNCKILSKFLLQTYNVIFHVDSPMKLPYFWKYILFCVYYICKNLDGTKRGEDLTKLLPLPHLKGQPIAFDYEYNKIKVILFFFFFLLLHFWLPKSCKIV